MAKDYLTQFLPDLEEFKEKTMQFHNGELTVAEYKRFSGGFGSYAQRGGQKHMLRLRMAGGRLTKERMHFIVTRCEKYGIDRLKMTTCQSIQLHNLKASDLCPLMEEAWMAGMISRGGGGDFPRNVMASPLSGVQKNEYFDVMPYAEAAGEYLMDFIKAVKFPRKLKVCFSNSPENETHATFRDLGFIARANHTFDVYIAGGLGIQPKLGICAASQVAPEKILYHIKAMVNTFTTYGNYENRGKARTRFMQETLGIEGLRSAYQVQLAKVLETESLDLHILTSQPAKQGIGSAISHKRIIPQKQNGLYSVFYQPIGGNLSPCKAAQLYQLIAPMKDVEIRLTPQEGLYIINCNSKEAQTLLEATDDGARNPFETSTACIGASICQVGIGDSQSLLSACINAVRKENFADGVLPKLHISGCPSSCGTHQIGTLGLRGGIRQTPDGPAPAFAVFKGGCPIRGKEVLADMGKSILAKDLPEFLIKLGRMISADDSYYEAWIVLHHEEFDQLLAQYTETTPLCAPNKRN
ncbi:MAG: nitrite/sulfite reductase [Lachnospiraceae bacterium]|nr:nitrite/sulfite reductase [Lachnospiraceae bacterium]MDE6186148.1 nitrite/sulfite reductase [Lachnospiraceae bacterium]